VGATNRNDQHIYWSCEGDHIDVSAPGESIWSTTVNSDYDAHSGTSQAAAQVSGFVGLLRAQEPSLTPDDIEQIIRLSATDIDSVGFDVRTGTGRINVGKGLAMLGSPYRLFQPEPIVGGTRLAWDWKDWMKFTRPPRGLMEATKYYCVRYPVVKDVTFPYSFDSLLAVWGRGTETTGYSTDGSTTGYYVEHGLVGVNYGMGWCGPVTGTIGSDHCRLQTYVYCVIDSASGDTLSWAPTVPDSVVFAYSVLGLLNATAIGDGDELDLARVSFTIACPNPLLRQGTFKLRISKPSQVRVELFDIAGRRVRTLHDGKMPAGEYQLRWDGTQEAGLPLASGVYFVRAQAGDRSIIRKLVLLR
jgi:hypothetical protein